MLNAHGATESREELTSVSRRGPARRRWVAGLGAGTALLAVAAFVTVSGAHAQADRTSVPPQGGRSGAGTTALTHGGGVSSRVSAQCVERYNPHTLRSRDFAFDGTVTAVGDTAYTPDGVPPGVGDPVQVTFRVSEWFRGGSGTEVTVAMTPPNAIISAGTTDYRVGTRLLVSGEPRFGGTPLQDPIAWGCGFTRDYDGTTALVWRRTLAT